LTFYIALLVNVKYVSRQYFQKLGAGDNKVTETFAHDSGSTIRNGGDREDLSNAQTTPDRFERRNQKERSVSIMELPSPSKRSRGANFDLRGIEVISFDLDDTLWHCAPVIEKAEQSMREFILFKGHQSLHDQLVHPVIEMHSRAVLAAYPNKSHDVTFIRRQTIQFAVNHCKIEDETICEAVFDHFFQARTSFVSEHIFPGVIEALIRLKALGFRIGAISNGNAMVAKIPEFASLIECHIRADLIGAAKPSREPFDALRDHFGGIEPHKVLHVGDSYESDVLGGLNAGMKVCWVVGGSNVTRDDKREMIKVRDVTQLADLFEREFSQKVENGAC